MVSVTPSALLGFSLLCALVAATPAHDSVVRRQLVPYIDNSIRISNSSLSNSSCYFWLENIEHQGLAPFQPDALYQVFRNVKDYGAVGDGVADDTAAINNAISSGGTCGPGSCNSTTTTPALVYFPAGSYLISSPIIDFYYTQLIGNPNCLPTIKAASNFTGIALIDGDLQDSNGNFLFGPTNIFWRQIRNFVLDMTAVRGIVSGVHWPTGQATSLQNMLFEMSRDNNTQHQGVLIDSGSGGFMNDLVFHGGKYGMNNGNQQFTMRNLTFEGCQTAIYQSYDWGWTYTGVHINNCQVGLNMSNGGPNAQAVGSVTFFDSDINNTPVGILTAFNNPSGNYTNGSLIVENVKLSNVPTAIQGSNGTLLAGTSGESTITAWGQGHAYTPNGPQGFQGPITPNNRPSSLLSGDAYYQRSKPQYETYDASEFISARTIGARGDGATDDTAALQAAIIAAAAEEKVLFIDAGDYKVSTTLYIPAGATIVGEAYPVILGYGSWFTDMNNPRPVVQIGKPGESGTVEWSDTIVSTQGATAGAILFEWNLSSGGPSSSSHQRRQEWGSWSTHQHDSPDGADNSPNDWNHGPPNEWHTQSEASVYETAGPSTTGNPGSTWAAWSSAPTATPQPSVAGGPSGMWDVHARIGGFAGSHLQLNDCPTTPTVATPPASVDQDCIAAFLTMHITKSASNLYLENVWLWVADHDVENQLETQITVYAGRGLLIESTGPLWLWGTAVEHHTLYEYQLVSAGDIYMGQIQTETAYYQPNPIATIPFPANPAYNDPDFSTQCYASSGFNFTFQTNFTNNCDGYALRIIDSQDVLVYGAGLYSFFDNYNTSCSARTNPGGAYGCQTNIFSLEGTNSNVDVYNLNTVGAQSMVNVDGKSVASYLDNLNVFTDGIALFRPDAS